MTRHELANHRIGENLRLLRRNRRETQAKVAAHLRLARPAISEVEAGRRSLTLAEAVCLAHHMQFDLQDLASGVPIR